LPIPVAWKYGKHPDPVIEKENDAIIRVTSAAICGSDLHMFEGRTSAQPGMVFGHEIMGVVEKVGKGVELVTVGDRVSPPFNVGQRLPRHLGRHFWRGAGRLYGGSFLSALLIERFFCAHVWMICARREIAGTASSQSYLQLR
jgi:threonine dehydrogenase-like Zn-dependent dehydrogenase